MCAISESNKPPALSSFRLLRLSPWDLMSSNLQFFSFCSCSIHFSIIGILLFHPKYYNNRIIEESDMMTIFLDTIKTNGNDCHERRRKDKITEKWISLSASWDCCSTATSFFRMQSMTLIAHHFFPTSDENSELQIGQMKIKTLCSILEFWQTSKSPSYKMTTSLFIGGAFLLF